MAQTPFNPYAGINFNSTYWIQGSPHTHTDEATIDDGDLYNTGDGVAPETTYDAARDSGLSFVCLSIDIYVKGIEAGAYALAPTDTGENWSKSPALAALNGELYAVDHGKLWKVHLPTGNSTSIGSECWADSPALATVNGQLYAVDQCKFWRVDVNTGISTQLGSETWDKDPTLVTVNDELYAVDQCKFWKVDVNTGISTQLGSETWDKNPALAALNGELYAVDQGKLWRVDLNTGVSTHIGSETWDKTPALVSVNGELYGVDYCKFWRVDINTGNSTHIGTEHWDNYATLVAANEQLYAVDKEKLWAVNTSTGISSELGAILGIPAIEIQNNYANDNRYNSQDPYFKGSSAQYLHILQLGGAEQPKVSICCHPLYYEDYYGHGPWSDLKAALLANEEPLQSMNVQGIEIYNGFNRRYASSNFAESCWDDMLQEKRYYHAFAGNDAYFSSSNTYESFDPFGSIFVAVDAATYITNPPEAVLTALQKGHFYASTGLTLDRPSQTVEYVDGAYQLQVSNETTVFWEIVADGNVVASEYSTSISYTIPSSCSYVRVRCSEQEGSSKKAWLQPVRGESW